MQFGWHRLTPRDLDLIEEGIIAGRPIGGPFQLELHPTNRCNADCFFCFTAYYRKGEALPFEMIRAQLEDQARRNLRFIMLSGGGEPLIYDRMGDLVKLMGDLGLRMVYLNTNAITLGKWAEPLTGIGSDQFFVSLNEPTAPLWARTMQVSEKMFHRAIDGIRAAVAARDAAPPDNRPMVTIQFMLNRDNHHLVAEMYTLAIGLGVDKVVMKSMVEVDANLGVPREAWPELERRMLEVIAEDARTGAGKLNVALFTETELNERLLAAQHAAFPPGKSPGFRFEHHELRREYCYIGWYQATVSANGEVWPCCVLHERPGKKMGDLRTESMQDVWHGDRYQLYRSQMRRIMLNRGEIDPGHCGSCLESQCVHRFGCLYNFDLASAAFYDSLALRMERDFSATERAIAQGRERLARIRHKILNRA